MAAPRSPAPGDSYWGLSRYQWLVLFAAWLGWGFDVFDALLFNYVAPICVPNLLGLPAGEKAQTTFWTGALTCTMLVGWGLGGIVFGHLTDRLGRTRTLLLTMLTYAGATAACAIAPNLYVLAALRFVASLGIGGEWAAGAALVAETVPEEKRVQAGALLYTSGPMGLFLATFVNDVFTRQLDRIAHDPSLSWRLVFLTGIVPAAAALAIRWRVREPEKWVGESGKLRELFSPELRRRTLGGLALGVVALITWWTCNAFLPSIARFLAERPEDKTRFVTIATTAFNLGGLVGTLGCVPLALRFGRRPMFVAYFAASALFVWMGFGASGFSAHARLYLMALQGLTVFGVFGALTFYLPELFPTRLRGTGAGFTYNTGRFITAPFPLLVGLVAQRGLNPSSIIQWVAVVPLAGVVLLLAGVGEETRGRAI